MNLGEDRELAITLDNLVAVVIGLGSIGLRHTRNFLDLGIGACMGVDPSSARRSDFEAQTGGRAFATVAEALAEGATLGVITSPSVFHVEQAIECAESGCSLFIEKPVGVTLEGIDHLIEIVESRRLFAHVGSNYKFHLGFREMKERLERGAIGSVTGVQVLVGQWLPDWHPYEDYREGYSARAALGGGVVLDSHELDYLTWLLGPIDNIEGLNRRSGCLEIETEDLACACFSFESGALGTLHVDYIQRDPIRRYHVSGDAGTLESDLRTGVLSHYDALSGKLEVVQFKEDPNEMYKRQAQHVLDGARALTSPVTSIAHARDALRLQLRVRENPV